jgi:hypothetical protein
MNDLGDFVIWLGLSLSGVALAGLVWMLVNCWRRDALPAASYGGLKLPERRLRWIWTLVLIGALGFGVAEDPIAQVTAIGPPDGARSAEPESEGALTRTWSLDIPLPFYRYEREVESRDGTIIRDSRVSSLLIPKPLLGAMVAYLVLVVWWHPNRRWARRLLLGKRAVRSEAASKPS